MEPTVPDAASPRLSGILGAPLPYAPGVSFHRPGFLQGNRAVRDFRTGDHLPVVGDCPVLCSRGVTAPDGLALLREAGWQLAPRIEYDDARTYAARLGELAAAPGPVVFQHAHPPGEFPPERYWIPRPLLCALNDKARLSEYAGDAPVPRRRVLDLPGLTADHAELRAPVVIKVSTDETTGGGRAVRLCRGPEDVRDALASFAGVARVVVEEHLPISRILCVQFAVGPDGRVRDLGFSEQIANAGGRYLGNWFDPREQLPDGIRDAGRAIMARAAALGYRGIAGFDFALCGDAPAPVIDLNFRLNGSTGPLLVAREATRRLGAPLLLYRSFIAQQAFAPAVRAAARAMSRGHFLPLCLFDPARTPRPAERPRVSGVLGGASRAEILDRLARMEADGLRPA